MEAIKKENTNLNQKTSPLIFGSIFILVVGYFFLGSIGFRIIDEAVFPVYPWGGVDPIDSWSTLAFFISVQRIIYSILIVGWLFWFLRTLNRKYQWINNKWILLGLIPLIAIVFIVIFPKKILPLRYIPEPPEVVSKDYRYDRGLKDWTGAMMGVDHPEKAEVSFITKTSPDEIVAFYNKQEIFENFQDEIKTEDNWLIGQAKLSSGRDRFYVEIGPPDWPEPGETLVRFKNK